MTDTLKHIEALVIQFEINTAELRKAFEKLANENDKLRSENESLKEEVIALNAEIRSN